MIDRVKCIGIERPESSDIMIFQAGSVRYRAIEDSFQFQLIDGENVHAKKWIHLEFKLRLMYLDQQLTGAHVPPALQTLETDQNIPTIYDTRVELNEILNIVRNAGETEVLFWPMLLRGDNTTGETGNYAIVPNQDTIDLIDAEKNGFFPMFTTLTFVTKNPLTSYPTWINR